MEPKKIDGSTSVIGLDQQYKPLYIRQFRIDDSGNETTSLLDYPCTESEWTLSDEERTAIAAGATVRLRILGEWHPPVMLAVSAVEALNDQ